MEPKKLYRVEEGKVIAGVCGGIAEYFNIDPTLVKLVWVLLSLFTAGFGGVIAYVICAAIIPTKSSVQ